VVSKAGVARRTSRETLAYAGIRTSVLPSPLSTGSFYPICDVDLLKELQDEYNTTAPISRAS